MFIAFQVLFAFGVGILLIGSGVAQLRSPAKERQQRWTGWLLVAIGIFALLWFPLLFADEASRTHTDSEGTYIDRGR